MGRFTGSAERERGRERVAGSLCLAWVWESLNGWFSTKREDLETGYWREQ